MAGESSAEERVPVPPSTLAAHNDSDGPEAGPSKSREGQSNEKY